MSPEDTAKIVELYGDNGEPYGEDDDDRLAKEALKRQSQAKITEDIDEQIAADALKRRSQVKAASSPDISTNEDVLKTIPSAVAKGVGAIPQLPAMGGNAVANSLGYATGKILGVPPDIQSKLNSLNPFFTGNTLPDALIQSGKAIATGNPGQQNPLSGDVLYNPQTVPGKLTQAAIEGGIAGPVAGAAGIPSALAGAAGQGAAEIYPNNPLAPLVAGGLTYAGAKGVSNAVTPTPLSPDVANVVKSAQDEFGIKVPSSVMTGGNNLIERMAGKADTSEMTSQINKTAADLIGANDGGENHFTINQKSFLDAKKNNGAAYQKLDQAIGNVPLDNHIGNIADQITSADQPRFDKISADIYSRLNPDGSISSANIRDLTGYDSSLRKYANSSNEDIAEPAQNIIKTLKTALQEKATPEQLTELAATDNKYKLMSEFQKTARESGAGTLVKPEAIRDVINKAYGSVNDYETPAKDVGNLLNTVSPKKSYQGSVPGVNAGGSNKFLGNAGLGASFLMGEPTTGVALKYLPMGASKLASGYVNSNWYRNKLLENAGH